MVLDENNIVFYQDQLSIAKRIIENEDDPKIKNALYLKLADLIFVSNNIVNDNQSSNISFYQNLASFYNLKIDAIKDLFSLEEDYIILKRKCLQIQTSHKHIELSKIFLTCYTIGFKQDGVEATILNKCIKVAIGTTSNLNKNLKDITGITLKSGKNAKFFISMDVCTDTGTIITEYLKTDKERKQEKELKV